MAGVRHLQAADQSAIVALAKIGDKQAFSELVRRHQSWVRSLLRRLSHDAVLADDLSQQAFMAAWVGIAGLQSIGAFDAWLRRIAMNTWLKYIRKRDPLHRAEVVEDTLIAQASGSLSQGIDIDEALAALPETERACVVLCYHEGLSHGAIKELTGLPLGTVKSHISRGRKRLQRILLAYGAPGLGVEEDS